MAQLNDLLVTGKARFLNTISGNITTANNGISNITRSGTTFTVTRADGSTFTFTQQDNNTTYAAKDGISLSSNTFTNSGVRAIATGGTNGTINVNTNGSTANVAVKGLGNLAYVSSTTATTANYATNAGTANYATSAGDGISNITR